MTGGWTLTGPSIDGSVAPVFSPNAGMLSPSEAQLRSRGHPPNKHPDAQALDLGDISLEGGTPPQGRINRKVVEGEEEWVDGVLVGRAKGDTVDGGFVYEGSYVPPGVRRMPRPSITANDGTQRPYTDELEDQWVDGVRIGVARGGTMDGGHVYDPMYVPPGVARRRPGGGPIDDVEPWSDGIPTGLPTGDVNDGGIVTERAGFEPLGVNTRRLRAARAAAGPLERWTDGVPTGVVNHGDRMDGGIITDGALSYNPTGVDTRRLKAARAAAAAEAADSLGKWTDGVLTGVVNHGGLMDGGVVTDGALSYQPMGVDTKRLKAARAAAAKEAAEALGKWTDGVRSGVVNHGDFNDGGIVTEKPAFVPKGVPISVPSRPRVVDATHVTSVPHAPAGGLWNRVVGMLWHGHHDDTQRVVTVSNPIPAQPPVPGSIVPGAAQTPAVRRPSVISAAGVDLGHSKPVRLPAPASAEVEVMDGGVVVHAHTNELMAFRSHAAPKTIVAASTIDVSSPVHPVFRNLFVLSGYNLASASYFLPVEECV